MGFLGRGASGSGEGEGAEGWMGVQGNRRSCDKCNLSGSGNGGKSGIKTFCSVWQDQKQMADTDGPVEPKTKPQRSTPTTQNTKIAQKKPTIVSQHF